LKPGQDVLQQGIKLFKKFPELAIFQDPDKTLVMEAYFSTMYLGVLKAKVFFELDDTQENIATYSNLDLPGKAMPSGKRKYELTESGVARANNLRIWKLAYVSSINYEPEQIERFFGKPEKQVKITQSVEYWFYPKKGVVISLDEEGSEIFYYAILQDYERLVKSLPHSKAEDE